VYFALGVGFTVMQQKMHQEMPMQAPNTLATMATIKWYEATPSGSDVQLLMSPTQGAAVAEKQLFLHQTHLQSVLQVVASSFS